MRLLGYATAATGIFCLLISSSIHSEDVKLADPSLTILPPTGFCELDKANKADIALFNGFSGYAKASGFSLIALYPDCRELKESRTPSGAFIRAKIAFAKFLKHADGPPSRYISEACDELRKGLSDEQKSKISEYVTKFGEGDSTLQSTLPLGVLDEDRGTVCFSGQLVKGKAGNAGQIALVYLTAATIIGDQPVSIFQWTDYVDASSIATALTKLKSTYSDFAKLNNKAN